MSDWQDSKYAGTYLEDAEEQDASELRVPQPLSSQQAGTATFLNDSPVPPEQSSSSSSEGSQHLENRITTPLETAEAVRIQRVSQRPASSENRTSKHVDKNTLSETDQGRHSATALQHGESADAPRSRNSESHEDSDRLSEEEEHGLTEVTAPQPVVHDDASGAWRRNETLESTEDQMKTERRTDASTGSKRFRMLTQLYIISGLVFFSLLGTLARLGTQWLTFYPGAPVAFSNLWANVGGTFIIGFLLEDRKIFAREWGQAERGGAVELQSLSQHDQHRRGTPETRAAHLQTKKTIPLYISLTVGFCGSYTSFSSFQRDVFFALANKLPTPLSHPTISPTTRPSATVPRNNGYSLAAVLAIITLTISACYAALLAGAALAKALDRVTPILPFPFLRNILDPLLAFLAWTSWLGAILLSILPPDRPNGPSSRGPWSNETWRGEVLFALVFAPLGCLLRFYLSIKLNSILASFPLGTFTANIFGTAVLGACLDLQHIALAPAGDAIGGGRVGCQVLQGIEDGFCGCLTTVSTWIVEIKGLRGRHAWFYGAASVGLGMAFCIVVMGSVVWSVGWGQVSCRTGNAG